MKKKIYDSKIGQKEISIFRTSFIDTNDIAKVKSLLNLLIGKNEWNFDLEDVDNILRVNANSFVNAFLIQEINKMGFECEELF